MIPLSQYVKVKNKYCICYFGPSRECLERLVAIRPSIEKELSGIEIYIACRDHFLYLAKNEPRIVEQSKLVEMKRQFGYIRELKSNFVQDPIEALLIESELKDSLNYYFSEINPQCNWKNS